MVKDLEYYLNLNWTLIEGEDLDFEGNPYHYIEIQEIPSFVFCAKTIEKARGYVRIRGAYIGAWRRRGRTGLGKPLPLVFVNFCVFRVNC